MRLYLVQHGHALSREVDPERPLSEQGRADVGRVAAFLAGAGIHVSAVLHSGKRRAEQTADLLARSIGQQASPARVAGIEPMDPVEAFAPNVGQFTGDTMVVGHLPFMGRLVSYLVGTSPLTATVVFQPGSVVCLDRENGGRWCIAWMIRPELIPG
jgi:phosphohistidine phosphatase